MSYHHIEDLQEQKIISMQYCSTEQMLADMLTKPLSRDKFKFFTDQFGFDERTTARRGVENDASVHSNLGA